jgi:hypothetical protein
MATVIRKIHYLSWHDVAMRNAMKNAEFKQEASRTRSLRGYRYL